MVRDLAAFATYYSDLMYWQFARMYSIALPKQTKAQMQCPNQQMHLLFDRIVQYLTVDDPQYPWFPHGAVLLPSPACMALCVSVFPPFFVWFLICLWSYYDDDTMLSSLA